MQIRNAETGEIGGYRGKEPTRYGAFLLRCEAAIELLPHCRQTFSPSTSFAWLPGNAKFHVTSHYPCGLSMDAFMVWVSKHFRHVWKK